MCVFFVGFDDAVRERCKPVTMSMVELKCLGLCQS